MKPRSVAVTFSWLFLILAPTFAQIPSTDIYLLAVDGDEVGSPRRVTDRDGYDNQPQFLPDGNSLVYSSLRHGGTDIYLYDVATGKTRVVVQTPESVYSPTPVPGRNAISVVLPGTRARARPGDSARTFPCPAPTLAPCNVAGSPRTYRITFLRSIHAW